MKNFNNLSNTEKLLTISVSLLILMVFVGALSTTKALYLPSHAQEESEPSEVSVESDEEDSDEESVASVESVEEDDELSVETVSTPSIEELSTPSVASEPSIEEEEEEVSTPSVASEPSVVSEPSVEEQSVRSGANLEEIEDYISLSDDVAMVYEDEKLFFLVPVKVEKTLLLDEEGTVVDVQQTLLNRLLSLFSF